MKAINPATGQLIRDYGEHTDADIARCIAAAASAFESWSRTSFADRAALVRRAADVLRQQQSDFANLMTSEMGKTLASAAAEVDKCVWGCQFYADHAERFLARQIVPTDAGKSYVRYDPLGPILAVMPWNFPFWQVFRFAAPALMAGNVVILKHAANVPGCALAIEQVFHKAGFPDGSMATLLISSSRVAPLVENPAIRAVTLTGSDLAGQSVAAAAGKQLKKTVLELGGSDPFIVLADADPTAVARQAAKARTINSGQSCIAAKRFIVEAAIADPFEQALAAEMKRLKVGDPLDRSTDVGPLAREDLLETLHDQVERSIQAGARLLTGGKRLPQTGYYYPPTVLAGVEPGMAAFDEETFGPVAAVTIANNADHAVELANRSPFGLSSSIWTADPNRGEALAARIDSGAVFVNEISKSDPRLPFGGVKRSGYGRELAEFGIREFVNIKTVWVK
jgi:succinate-semialdehyde dehydrogenase/glutarate-semialdehyde dehydrogenase